MPSTQRPVLTLYQVCQDLPGEALCEPLSPHQYVSKRAALQDLRECRRDSPTSYLAKITYTRLPEAKKGRTDVCPL